MLSKQTIIENSRALKNISLTLTLELSYNSQTLLKAWRLFVSILNFLENSHFMWDKIVACYRTKQDF